MATAQRPPKNHFEDHTIGTFRNWLKEQPGVEPKTIDALVADGFTSLSIFACIKEEDIASLKPKKGDAPLNDPQKAVLEALVVKTQLEKEGKSSVEFKEWLQKERKLQKNTMNALLEKGFKTFESAVGLKDSDIDDLQVAGPQKEELKKLKQDVWEKMEDEAKNFKTWLKNKGVNTKTMNNLHRDKIKNLTIFADMAAPKCALYGDSRGQTSLLHSLGDMMSKIKKGADLCRAKENGGKGTRPGPRKRKPADNPQPSTSRQEETGVKRPKTSRDSAAGRGEEVSPLEKELLRYIEAKKQQQGEAGKKESGPASFTNFGKKEERALDVGYMITVLKEAPPSVAMIMYGGSHEGTGFRVGSHYIMTCLHVVSGIMGVRPEDRLKLEAKFNHISGMGQPTDVDIKEMVYHDEALDVAILEIDVAELEGTTPLKLSSYAVDGPLCFLGHPAFGHNTQMMLDTSIEMIALEDVKKDATTVDEYYKTLLESCNSHENPNVVYKNCGIDFERPEEVIFDGMLNDNFRIIHTAFLPGASGSPGVQVDRQGRMAVRLMLCRGFPRFYYDLTDAGRALLPMPSQKFRFEHGLDINRLYMRMLEWVRDGSDHDSAIRQQFLDEIFN